MSTRALLIVVIIVGLVAQIWGQFVVRGSSGGTWLAWTALIGGYAVSVFGCIGLAKERGYSPIVGLIGLLSCIGLVILLVLPDNRSANRYH